MTDQFKPGRNVPNWESYLNSIGSLRQLKPVVLESAAKNRGNFFADLLDGAALFVGRMAGRGREVTGAQQTLSSAPMGYAFTGWTLSASSSSFT